MNALVQANRKRSDSELEQGQALNTIVKKNKRIKDLEVQQLDIWTALMDKAVADGKRRKDTLDAAAASSSNQPPPPPGPGADKPRIVQNPVKPMPSNQPSGVALPGPERAVQPNGGLSIPANLPPSVNKIREDDNHSIRLCAKVLIQKLGRMHKSRLKQGKKGNERTSETLKKGNTKLDGKRTLLHHLKSLQNRLLQPQM